MQNYQVYTPKLYQYNNCIKYTMKYRFETSLIAIYKVCIPYLHQHNCRIHCNTGQWMVSLVQQGKMLQNVSVATQQNSQNYATQYIHSVCKKYIQSKHFAMQKWLMKLFPGTQVQNLPFKTDWIWGSYWCSTRLKSSSFIVFRAAYFGHGRMRSVRVDEKAFSAWVL